MNIKILTEIGEVVRMSAGPYCYAGLWVVIDNSNWYNEVLSIRYAQGKLNAKKGIWRANTMLFGEYYESGPRVEAYSGASSIGRLATLAETQAVLRVVGLDEDEPPRITGFLRYAARLGCEMTPAQTAQLL